VRLILGTNGWCRCKMIPSSHKNNESPAPLVALIIVIRVLIVALLLTSHSARAEDNELSKESQACLKCHDQPGLEKTLENNEILSLHVSTDSFLKSMHKKTDCEDCHSDIDAKTHGSVKSTIKSKRAFALSLKESCRECHKKNFKTSNDSLHAPLVNRGEDKAPICSDCHTYHTPAL